MSGHYIFHEVQFRIALHYDVHGAAGSPESSSLLYENIINHVVRAEEIGFDIAWIAEYPGDPDAALPCALLVCAACAVRTNRMRIGTAVLPLPLYHPLRVAEDAATLDGIADGRFELGVGLGSDRGGFLSYGIPVKDRPERLEESIHILRQSWSHEPVHFKGKHFSISGTKVAPKSMQPGGPPLWIGAGAREAQRRAARLGVGLFLPAGITGEAYVESWREGGRSPDEMRIAFPVVLDAPVSELVGRMKNMVLSCGNAGRFDAVLPALTKNRTLYEPQFLETLLKDLRAELVSLSS